ncbi:hypothetical protein [Nitrobacter sp.]|uniref:hypothetical protein n=1 Tax=Nitrobacter sp. TaxID=29420 RepID=UPI003F652809
MSDPERVGLLLKEAKRIACEYYFLTKKPLGVTGEVAEYEAAKWLELNLETARTPYYDASKEIGGRCVRYQIKGRAVDRANPRRGRVGSIRLSGDFDSVLLVLLDKETLDAIEIWEASKQSIQDRIAGLTGAAPTQRNAISISQFVSQATIGATKVWAQAQ